MSAIYIPLLLGSVRQGRRSEAVGRFLLAKLEEDARFDPEWVDLADYEFELLRQRPSEMAEPPAALAEFSNKLRRADAVLIVTPEYKGGIPGALKNAFDLLDPGILSRRPVGLCTVSAGGFGGMQCLLQLRLTTLALGGVPIPATLAVSRVQDCFGAEDELKTGAKPPETREFFDELHFYGDALKEARQKTRQNREPAAAVRI